VDRREFLRTGVILGGAAIAGASCMPAIGRPGRPRPHESILGGAPGDSGIDTVVIAMMENRSFDSYFGYLAENEGYLERGYRKYGRHFSIDGKPHQAFPDANGNLVETYRRFLDDEGDPWRGCDHPDPGHGWDKGRAERDFGFLAPGSGNDDFALSYFLGRDLPVYKHLARRFTVCDHNHASLLGPTFPNREYLLSGQSGGHKDNYLPVAEGGFAWETIVDRLAAAKVTVLDYATDLPPLALWGGRTAPYIQPLANYFTAAAAGDLPQVSFVDPGFVGGNRSDDHPHGDPRAAQRFVRDAFAAFARSPHWERGLFILTYDEWGGFFDHVKPPLLPDDRASKVDQDNFAQAGFRVPLVLCSPRALPNFVDHRRYDHTSILRFLEWRFLGAPPEGPGAPKSTRWWLTTRDRHANNIGRSLAADVFDPDPGFDLDVVVGEPSPPCVEATAGQSLSVTAAQPALTPFEEALEAGYFERVGIHVPV
jgi:phospholipase C